MKKNFTLMVALTAGLILSLAACGGGSSGSDAGNEAAITTSETTAEEQIPEDNDGTGENSYSERTVVVGTVGGSQGYSVLNDDGTWTGIDGDLWNEIVKRTGWNLEIKRVDFSGTWGELDAGRIDVASNFWAINDTRREKYNVTIPYAADVQLIAVPEDKTDINTFEDLRGATIAVFQGQSAQYSLQAIQDQYDFNVIVYEDATAAMQDMLLGRVDAYAANITYFSQYEDEFNVKVHTLEEKLNAVNVGLYTAKTEDGTELVNELNIVLQEMLDDGTVSDICNEWLGMDMTQYIIEE